MCHSSIVPLYSAYLHHILFSLETTILFLFLFLFTPCSPSQFFLLLPPVPIHWQPLALTTILFLLSNNLMIFDLLYFLIIHMSEIIQHFFSQCPQQSFVFINSTFKFLIATYNPIVYTYPFHICMHYETPYLLKETWVFPYLDY